MGKEGAPLGPDGLPKDLEGLQSIFKASKYIAEKYIETTVYLALKLGKPLLIEGNPGCGKTEIAKVLSEGLGVPLIRLQCYEGLDVNTTIYEWDYMRQLLMIRMEEGRTSREEMEKTIFNERFLLKRPLLEAVLYDGLGRPVLLIDEIDRADEEFEGFLLEFLGEFQITVPEIGTFKAKKPPIVVITSNNTRELGDGLRRRCVYLYVSYPSPEKELAIVKLKVPGLSEKLAERLVGTVAKIRSMEEVLRKPGTAETIDWATAIEFLKYEELDAGNIEESLSFILKNASDISRLNREKIQAIISELGG